jgi:hypothetical protein
MYHINLKKNMMSVVSLGGTAKRKKRLFFPWTATFVGKQVDRKLMFEGQICQFETSYRRTFLSIFTRVVFVEILTQTVQLNFSTVRSKSYLCCVGKSVSTKEAGIFVIPP